MSATDLNYRPDIDGLRAVAVLAVVLHHLSAPLLPGGYVGVDVFFVISGYLITRIICREMDEGTFTFARFYERRARRIFPALFAVLGASLLAGYALLLPSDMGATLRGALGALLFTSNVVFWRDLAAGYFAAADAALNPLLHTWSLAVEEQFYVFFPVLLLACFRWARRYFVLALIVCALVSLAGAALLVQSKSVAVFFLSPFRAWELLMGALLAVDSLPPLRSRVQREAVAGAGLLAIAVTCFVYDDKTIFPGLAALAPVLGAAALIHTGASGPTIAGRLLQLPPMVWLGLVSYSLYLWHWPLIVFTRYAIGFEPINSYIPLLLCLSLGLAALSYRFIEQPFRRSANISGRVVFASSAGFAVLLSAIAVVGLLRGGFESRFGHDVVKLDQARTPQIPFRDCDGRPLNEACILGASAGVVTTLIWGDSHALAWAPALDEVFKDKSRRALFANLSACPPLFGISNPIKPVCASQNRAVRDHLLANPAVETIILSAYWSTYFKEGGPLTSEAGGAKESGSKVAQAALVSTIQWLLDSGRKVVLIGPVPVYDKSVPLALALEAATGEKLLHSSMQDQRDRHTAFFAAVDRLDQRERLHFLDPISWLCLKDCKVKADGASLYRDSHHLSVSGAMWLTEQLTAATETAASREPQENEESQFRTRAERSNLAID